MARTVVLGASGLVGASLLGALNVSGTSHRPREGLVQLDSTDEAAVRRVLAELRPESVINCVGLADVDRAERDPALADALNRAAVRHLVRAQSEFGFRLIHISTDYVFDGRRGGYLESDAPNPVNEYGRSKLHGERELDAADRPLILRISAPYGATAPPGRTQFYRYVSESLAAGKTVRAVTDQRVTATFLPDLAQAVARLMHREVAGVVHVTSSDAMSRFDFARAIARTLHADPGLVVPATRAEMAQWTAPRPSDTSLDVGRSVGEGVAYTPVAEALRQLLTPAGLTEH